jgi:N-acetylmuramoyl-L-alanine amidase
MAIKKSGKIILLFICVFGLLWAVGAQAVAPREQYFNAEASYRDLRDNPAKRKYRSNWMRCIEKFQSVYQLDPDGPWAAAGLYMSGNLYRELAKYSGSPSDQNEAVDIFERIVKRFPNSRYRRKAQEAIASLAPNGPAEDSASGSEPQDKPSSTAAADDAKEAYYSAEACYRDLCADSKKMKYRHNWSQCIDKFHDVYRLDPTGPWAAAGLYMSGKLYQELYGWSKSDSDLQTTRNVLEQIVKEFPDSRYKTKASVVLQALPAAGQQAAVTPGIDLPQNIESDSPKISSNGRVTVENLRFWSNPNYTRLVIDADRETSFYPHLLKKDPSINKPQRLYVDLGNSRMGESIPKIIPIDDDLLTNARAGQYTSDTVRVVVDIKSFKTYKIFSLKDPFRIVIDVWGSADVKTAPLQMPDNGTQLPSGALAKQLALGVSRIVIDPGHGGKDYGAPGYLKGVHEKDVVLEISKRLAQKIRAELNCEAILTRSNDRYLTLEERTAFANTKNADLFISIHTNSSRDRRAYGIETYFLNLATDDDAIRVAAFENATSTKNISDLQTILNDLMQNAKINESSRLAGYVQSSLIAHLNNKKWSRIKNKGVKQAPFYVLLGAQMPSILVETSFISNARECNRLTDSVYQDRLCEAIVQGVKNYIRETTPTALLKDGFRQRPQG